MSEAERAAYAARGGYCAASTRFLEDIAHALHQNPQDVDGSEDSNEIINATFEEGPLGLPFNLEVRRFFLSILYVLRLP